MPNDPLRLDPKALPCPFCGGVPVVDGEDSTWAMLCRVRCGECNANRMSYTKTRVEAIAAWNRRAALPVPTSEEPRITVGHRRAIGVVEAGIAGPMDWPEDFAHENGRYFNACHSCACIFVGHKRRVICRVCSAPIPPIREDVERAVEEHGEACYEVGFVDADRDLREAPVARRNAARAHLLSLFPSGGTVPPAVPEAPVLTETKGAGAWNNWIAPFHRCACCRESLNWEQSVDVFDRPLISASCTCRVFYSVPLSTEGLESLRAVDAGNKLVADICAENGLAKVRGTPLPNPDVFGTNPPAVPEAATGDSHRPVVIVDKVIRFQKNALVYRLYEEARARGFGLYELADAGLGTVEEWRELAQLIGYSLSGYCELNYVCDDSAECDRVEALARAALPSLSGGPE